MQRVIYVKLAVILFYLMILHTHRDTEMRIFFWCGRLICGHTCLKALKNIVNIRFFLNMHL